MSTGVDALGNAVGLFKPRQYAVAALLGIVIVFSLFHKELQKRTCEFATFYVGARLSGTPDLYDPDRSKKEQIRAIHAYGDPLSYVRLPFYASLLSPIAKLPYTAALCVWQTLSAIAIVAFVLLWREHWMALVACAWSLPLLTVFMLGEDDNFLLVALALALAINLRYPLIAGSLLALLGIKFNLFLLLPALLIAQKRWRMLAGFGLGCVALLGVSFYSAGVDWPVHMAAILAKRSILPHEYLMPNLRGLLAPLTDSLWPELLLDVLVIGIVYLTCRRVSFRVGVASMLVGSLLVSHHAGIEDCVMLIPAILLSATEVKSAAVLCFYAVLLCPITYWFLVLGPPLGVFPKLSLLSLLCFLWYRRSPLTSLSDLRWTPPPLQ